MGTIAFIACFEEIFEIGQKIIAELGLSKKTNCYIGWLKHGVEIARKAEAGGADVIVSRGRTAELIAKSGIQVPIIEIPITFKDLAGTLLKAKKIANKDNPQIAVLAFKNVTNNVEVFAQVMGIDLKIYPLDSDEEISSVVEQALKDNIDVIIGGIQITSLASARGAKTVLLTSGEDSYRDAILQAEKVLYARTLEKERMKMFRVLVDSPSKESSALTVRKKYLFLIMLLSSLSASMRDRFSAKALTQFFQLCHRVLYLTDQKLCLVN